MVSGKAGREGVDTVTTGGVDTVSPAAPPKRRSPTRWIVIGGIALVFVLIIGYILAGAALASGPVAKADSALKSTLSHDRTYSDVFSSDPFKNIDFNASTPDIAGAKSALTKARQDIANWQRDISADRAALSQARADLRSSLLTLPEQSTINTRRHRVDAALSALDSAQQGADIASKQMALLEPFLDAVGGFVAFGNAGSSNDLGAMQNQLGTISSNLQKTAALAQSASLPPQALAVVKTMQQAASDLQALLSAAQAGDASTAQKYEAAVEADAKALEATDSNAIDKADQALFQPLSDAYQREMKIAAGY